MCDDFFDACKYGNLDDVKKIIEKKIEPLIDYKWGLILASGFNYINIVKYLISMKVNVQACFNEALKYAYIYNNLEIVQYLVSAGANISMVLFSIWKSLLTTTKSFIFSD